MKKRSMENNLRLTVKSYLMQNKTKYHKEILFVLKLSIYFINYGILFLIYIIKLITTNISHLSHKSIDYSSRNCTFRQR